MIIFSLAGCAKPSEKQPAPISKVSAIKVEYKTIPMINNYIGITTSILSVGIRARVKGFLIKKNFIEGAFVKKGELLFEIDPTSFKAKLRQAEAALANAIAEVNYQKIEYLRMKELYAKQVISKQQFDRTDTAYKQALAQVVQEQANVESAKINLSYCYMYSPIDGMIGKINVDVGNLVGGAEDTLLATVVKLDPIYVEFSPSVSDFGEFLKFKKSSYSFSVKAYLPKYQKMVFPGKVDLVNNEANTKTATVLMRAIINNPQKLLLPGLYVNLELILDPNYKALMVPEIAVVQGQGVEYLYIITDKDIVERKNVITGKAIQGMRVIDSGLTAGEIIVTSNLEKIKPGEKIDYQLENN